MAIKKTQLYSILWESCNILRGSMDASQYKNYVLTMLFLKYISDKVKSDPNLYFDLPEGCSFDDIIALKNKPEIGEEIQKKLQAIARVNPRLDHIINEADFDDSSKLGSGKAKVDTLSSLIAVFQRDFLDFSNNRAGDDDIIGDAYEYLMKNFAAESGKKKGQFYTPAEVSRLMARILGIHKDTRPQISIYDPTCGSGSLLLRAKAEARVGVAIFGQELDGATRGMAVMNMFLHGVDDPEIEVGDTIEKPFFLQNANQLTTFNYVVANPPFSQKGWIKGEIKTNDTFGRWGDADNLPPIPPSGYEDYAFLLHIIKSLNSQGRGACILPNGVLFRGNEEEAVRRKIVDNRYIRGIISLPPNLFFGTGIPACIIIIDKAKARSSKGIFMIDARSGFTKDGAKNRLREQDIRRIVDAWESLELLDAKDQLTNEEIIPHFARFVPYSEITNERNNYNLNVSRYISPVDTEIHHDLFAHLKLNGGLPKKDVEDDFSYLWLHCPTLKDEIFTPLQGDYYKLAVERKDIPETIAFNKEFRQLSGLFSDTIEEWYRAVSKQMFELGEGCEPKKLIAEWSETLLEALAIVDNLTDMYNVYDVLLNYWNDVMQDDCYLISREGWKAELSCQVLTTDKKSKEVKFVPKKNPTFRDYYCDLLPVYIVIDKYFKEEYSELLKSEETVAQLKSEIEQMEEEYQEELNETLGSITLKYFYATCPKPLDGEKEALESFLATRNKEERKQIISKFPKVFNRLDNNNQNTIKARFKEIINYAPLPEDAIELYWEYIRINSEFTKVKNDVKERIKQLTKKVVDKYPQLREGEIKAMVINDKWHTSIVGGAIVEAMNVTNQIEQQVVALADRYERRLSDIDHSIRELEDRVNSHLAKMGFEL